MSSSDGSYRQLRLRAEALLEQSVDLEEALSHRDVRALIHDLSVHQIELEMQNDELQQAQREMRQVRDEYLKLYNHAPIGYFSLDDQGIILKHNQTVSTMLGNPALVAIGMPLGSFMFPEDREIFQARYKAIFKSPQEKNVELRFCRTDGSLFWGRLSGRRDTCLLDNQEIREVLLLAVADISSEKQAEEELRLTRDAANTANRAKSEFLAGISHEIRTPMNGILGMVQLMELSELTEEQKEYLDILKMSGSNLLTLINNILDLSKIEATFVCIGAQAKYAASKLWFWWCKR